VYVNNSDCFRQRYYISFGIIGNSGILFFSISYQLVNELKRGKKGKRKEERKKIQIEIGMQFNATLKL
jgi:hypothetical protein